MGIKTYVNGTIYLEEELFRVPKRTSFLMHYVQMPELLLQLQDILNTAENNLKKLWMKMHSIY